MGHMRQITRLEGVGFGSVLVLLVSAFLLEIMAPDRPWLVSAQTVLVGAAALGITSGAGMSPRVRRVATVVVAAVVVAVVSSPSLVSDDGQETGASAVRVLLTAGAMAVIIRWFARQPRVDLQSVAAALCVYTLWGMLFGRLYGFLAAADPDPLFVLGSDGTASERMYFSFVTLTTTGYGDYSVAEPLGRGLAAIEALGGQLYLVSVVALLVGNLGRPTRRSGETGG